MKLLSAVLLFSHCFLGAADSEFVHLNLWEVVQSNSVFSIVQDPSGLMWFGTDRGLVTYDGFRFRRFDGTRPISSNLDRSPIMALARDPKSGIWIGSQDGLWHYRVREHHLKRYGPDPERQNSLPHQTVLSLFFDRDDVLWVGTDGGLARHNPDQDDFTVYRHDPTNPNSLVQNEVYVIRQDRGGHLWLGTEGGLSRFDPDTERFTNYVHDPAQPNSLIPGGIYALTLDAADNLWVGAAPNHVSPEGGGLAKLDANRTHFKHIIENPGPQRLEIRNIGALFRDGRERIWVGLANLMGGGLSLLDPQREMLTHIHPYRSEVRSLLGTSFATFYVASDGWLWIGTHGTGIYKLDTNQLQFHPVRALPHEPNSLRGNHTWTIGDDSAGRVWVGTLYGGLSRWDPETNRFDHYAELPTDPETGKPSWLTAIHVDGSDRVRIGTWGGGLGEYEPESDRIVPLGDEQPTVTTPNRHIKFMQEGSDGELWIFASHDLQRLHLETGELTQIDYPETFLPIGYVRVASNVHDGQMWIYRKNEPPTRFDTRSQQFHFEFPAEKKPPQINALHLDHRGELWIGTAINGLLRYDPETRQVSRFDSSLGLVHNLIWGIQEDRAGTLWLHTPKGISQFDPENTTFRNFRIDVDFQAHRYGFSTVHRGRQDQLFFGGYPGFLFFDPATIEEPRAGPPVILTHFECANPNRDIVETLDFLSSDILRQGITLPHDEADFLIQFAALTYADPSANRYAYMLENFDPGWRPAGIGMQAAFVRLPPGHYVFKVKAANPDGVWSADPLTFPITITPPWWRTTLARFLFFVGSFALLVWAFRFQQNYCLRKERAVHQQREKQMQIEAAQLQARAAAASAEALREENARKNLELAKARELAQINARLEKQTAALTLEREKTEHQAKKLLELDRLKSRFFANISHELRTPLALILPPLQDALDHRFGPLQQNLQRMLKVAHHEGTRLLRLINQLLELAKLEAGAMELRARRGNLVSFLERIVSLYRSLGERRHIDLQFQSNRDEIIAFFDPDKLEKVFYNLLSNAFKYTAEGGKIKLSIAWKDGEDGEWVQIQVKDTGEGIPEDEIQRVFDRFYQVSREKGGRRGTGLGLSLVRELTELHHGRVAIASEPGFGSTFCIDLPLAREAFAPGEILDAVVQEDIGVQAVDSIDMDLDLAAVTDDTGAIDEPTSGAPTILVVEDNPSFRQYLLERLAERYKVIGCENGEVALKEARREPPDLVLSDVMMPEMDGYALCRELRADASLAHVPVILLTAKASDHSKIEGLQIGADDYLAKPFNMAELSIRIENLIEIRRTLRRRFSKEMNLGPKRILAESADEAFLRQIQQVVETHMEASAFGVAQLAEEVGLSQRQLQRKLREITRLSPAGFLRTMRLQRAADLLEQEAGTVAEVAYRAGFKNPEHFSRLFAQVFGVAPSKYKDYLAERMPRETAG
ncbi:Response regulator [Sulfidibacter corallicola]|uniref:histidine kinase n=1 Tax=Sulfidibacter corallicola TaxID=2818388 RepID=A0A8A4TH38_SULCO|nr:two-component regulator propeller domain-containing protein [Sulfidibacter corallicola]QTD48870.1 response regulator [Sulfidibacter corallicola]